MTPKQIKAARTAAKLSAAEAARIVGLAHGQAWQRYEQTGANARAIPQPTLHLFRHLAFELPRILDAVAYGTQVQGRAFASSALAAAILVEEGRVTDTEAIIATLLRKTAPPIWFGPDVMRLAEEASGPGPRSPLGGAIVLAGLVASMRGHLPTRVAPFAQKCLAVAEAVEKPNPRLLRLVRREARLLLMSG